jgi:hypothetical protein
MNRYRLRLSALQATPPALVEEGIVRIQKMPADSRPD